MFKSVSNTKLIILMTKFFRKFGHFIWHFHHLKYEIFEKFLKMSFLRSEGCFDKQKIKGKIKAELLFFIYKHLFKYHEGYIVPVFYLNSRPDLFAFANIIIPYIVGKATSLYEFSLPKRC